MCVVIVGGNDRVHGMIRKPAPNTAAKPRSSWIIRASFGKNRITGSIHFFTGTVLHKMVESAAAEAKRCNARIARSHSSLIALHANLKEHCPAQYP